MKKLLAILIGTVLAASALLAVLNTAQAEITVGTEKYEEGLPCCILKHEIILGVTHSEKECPTDPDETCPIANCNTSGGTPDSGWAGYCLIDSVATVTDWIKWLGAAVTIVAILVAGIMFITAGGNPERVGKAKKMILYSIIGVAIIVSAQMVPSLIKFFI